MNATERLEDLLLTNSGISYWLKDAIKSSANRDVLDALYDAEMLVKVCQARCDAAGLRLSK